MSFSRLEAVRRLPSIERATVLIDAPEDQWFERKSGRLRAKALAQTLVAMGNAEGGLIVIGIHDGAPDGIHHFAGAENEWRQTALDLTLPPVHVHCERVEIEHRGVSHDVMLLEVEQGELVHAVAGDVVYLRVGDESRKLTFQQRQELTYDKGQSNYEASPVPGSRSSEDLNQELAQEYATSVGHPDAVRLLQARGLATADGGLTLGGLLLFGRMPQARLPNALVRVTRYRGTERGSGARQQLLHDERIEGAIPQILARAREVLMSVVPTRQALGSDGRFGPIGLVPEDAWMEGLVNAVVHRSYSMAGDHIRIDVFDDRIEFESPGRFPGLVDLENPERVTRFARNPRIARVCADLRYGQEFGEGIRRMFEEMRLAGLADPVYAQTSGSVRLTLTTHAVDHELERRLPADGREILQVIRGLDRPSTGELLERLDLSRPTLLRRLSALEDLGLVQRIATGPNDPRAYWRICVE